LQQPNLKITETKKIKPKNKNAGLNILKLLPVKDFMIFQTGSAYSFKEIYLVKQLQKI
jgi:hypothetical protein